MLAMNGYRISPVFNVAQRFLSVDVTWNRAVTRKEAFLWDKGPVVKTNRLTRLSTKALICNAISGPLKAVLASAGIRVISNACGTLDEMVVVTLSGNLTEQTFSMPKCPRRRYRHRHRHGNQSWNR